ncbi:MAG: hypothetical protein ACLU99_12365 [Alphaproteobacteria bacterium]
MLPGPSMPAIIPKAKKEAVEGMPKRSESLLAKTHKSSKNPVTAM